MLQLHVGILVNGLNLAGAEQFSDDITQPFTRRILWTNNSARVSVAIKQSSALLKGKY
jgi:hypothetical protein